MTLTIFIPAKYGSRIYRHPRWRSTTNPTLEQQGKGCLVDQFNFFYRRAFARTPKHLFQLLRKNYDHTQYRTKYRPRSNDGFIFDKEHDIFILHGGAGSSKNSVIARLVHELKLLETSHKIMAPTGRAARILADKLNAYSQNKEERSVTSPSTAPFTNTATPKKEKAHPYSFTN